LIFIFNGHAYLSLFGLDHHRLVTHSANHIERIAWLAPQGLFQNVGLDALLDDLTQLTGDLEESIGRAEPADALMRPSMVVIGDPEPQPLLRFFEAAELRPAEEFGIDRFPEPLDFSKGHGMMRPGFDMLDPVFLQLVFETGRPPPVGILPTVVGEHFLRNTVVGNSAAKCLQHVIGCLGAVQAQRGDVARVIVEVADQVGRAATQSETEDIALPHTIGNAPFKESGLGGVVLRLALWWLHQALFSQKLAHSLRTDRPEEQPPQQLSNPPASIGRVLTLQLNGLLLNRRRDLTPALPARNRLEAFFSMFIVDPHPVVECLGAHTDLTGQGRRCVALLEIKLHSAQFLIRTVTGTRCPLRP
jgi:hypothetical protein